MDQSEETFKELLPVLLAPRWIEDNIPCKIEEGLYLGSLGAALNTSALESCNITHILSIFRYPSQTNELVFKIVDIPDVEGVNILEYQCFEFIDEAKKKGGGVLVHCSAGISKSVKIVVSYLMKKHGMSLSQALEQVKSKRPVLEDDIPCKIEEGLYMGSLGAVTNRSALESFNITHILSFFRYPSQENDLVSKIVDIPDFGDVNISQYFDECIKFIDEAKKNSGAVFVHCLAGVSGSVTIVVAYLMKKHRMSLSQALKQVTSKRPVASPNSGFISQLQDFEKTLEGTDQSPNESKSLKQLAFSNYNMPQNISMIFTLAELQYATKYFNESLFRGEGSYGKVYEGYLADGQVVAVKMMKISGMPEFRAEIKILSKINHPNVIKLLGFCDEEGDFLVYEYMSLGSLADKLLTGNLDWKTRMVIASGLSDALHHLHAKGDRPVIYHNDIKYANVLLASDYSPKLSDFGAAKEHSRALVACMASNPDLTRFGATILGMITGISWMEVFTKSKPEVLSACKDGITECLKWADPSLDKKYHPEDVFEVFLLASNCMTQDMQPRVEDVASTLRGLADKAKAS